MTGTLALRPGAAEGGVEELLHQDGQLGRAFQVDGVAELAALVEEFLDATRPGRPAAS